MHSQEGVVLKVVKTLEDYPPGLIGVVAALFGRCMAASHGVDWTFDLLVAEEQCKFYRNFDPERDRVWVVMDGAVPRGALTIEGPRPQRGQDAARLRFFILDPSLRGRGYGRTMLREAMQFCRASGFRRVRLTTLPDLDAAFHLYREQGFVLASHGDAAFHGSDYAEQTLEWKAGEPGCGL